jgi:hypothetical protein
MLLIIGSVATAFFNAEAPRSFAEAPGLGPAIASLVLLALMASVAQHFAGRQRGAGALESPGPAQYVGFAKVVFQLAHLFAVIALGALTAILAGFGSGLVDPLFRALLLLLVGGAVVSLAGGLMRDLLFLLVPRSRSNWQKEKA